MTPAAASVRSLTTRPVLSVLVRPAPMPLDEALIGSDWMDHRSRSHLEAHLPRMERGTALGRPPLFVRVREAQPAPIARPAIE